MIILHAGGIDLDRRGKALRGPKIAIRRVPWELRRLDAPAAEVSDASAVADDSDAPLVRGLVGEIRSIDLPERAAKATGTPVVGDTCEDDSTSCSFQERLRDCLCWRPARRCRIRRQRQPRHRPQPRCRSRSIWKTLARSVVASPAAGRATPGQIYVVTFDASKIVERVMPAVVTVINEQRFGDGMFGETEVEAGRGTGFIIDGSGNIVTNRACRARWHRV